MIQGVNLAFSPDQSVLNLRSAVSPVLRSHPLSSVNTITQWTEDWSSASVLNHTIITDPTIRQPGFHLPRHTRSLMNRSGQVVLTYTNGVSPNHLPVIVASDRP